MKKLTGIFVAFVTAFCVAVSASALTIFESRYINGVEYKMVTDISRYDQKYQDANKFLNLEISNIVKVYHAEDLWENLIKNNSPEITAQLCEACYMAKDGSFGMTKVIIKDGDIDVIYDGFDNDTGIDETFRSIFTASDYTDKDGGKHIINDIYYFDGKNGEVVVCYYTPGKVYADVYPEGLSSSKVLKSLSEAQLNYLAVYGKKFVKENEGRDFYEFMKADGYSVPENPEKIILDEESSAPLGPMEFESNAYYDTPDNSALLAIYMMLFLIVVSGAIAIVLMVRDKIRSDKSSKIMNDNKKNKK